MLKCECDCQKMAYAPICAQDWLKSNTRIDMNDYFDELRDLKDGNLQCLFYFCLGYLLYYIISCSNFYVSVLYILIFVDLTKLSLKDNVIDIGDTLNN